VDCNIADQVSIYVPNPAYISMFIIDVCQTDREYRNDVEACNHCRI
jgi:hypothetical protein